MKYPLGLLYPASMVRDLCEIDILDCLVKDFTISQRDGITIYGTPYGCVFCSVRLHMGRMYR